jgi:L-2-hydroxyglutarate oxidase LhgO
MDIDCGITVIGAGIVGLAIASALSEREQGIYILEKERTHGRGISSRNSEVVHAGIYYPPGSLKSKFCIEGKELLYEICAKQNIPHSKTGKLIIARTGAELGTLENLKANAERSGVASLSLMDEAQLRAMEPNVRAVGGLFSPDTGIVNAHLLMDYYLRNAKQHGADIACGTTVKGIERVEAGYRITTMDEAGEQFEFVTERVVNAAGLYADEIAGMLGDRYAQYYCKGDYFSVNNVRTGTVKRLIYPVPEVNHVGLGVHVTLDLSGRMRLGPDAVYIDKKEDYRVDAAKRDAFYESAVTFLPFLQKEHIVPEMSGIRPKLQGPGEPFRDFVISEDHPGFVNLVGIESPGLTAAPAIANYVGALVTSTRAAA